MQTANLSQKPKHHDPVWHFLLEYSLSEFGGDEELEDKLTTGSLFKIINNLGMPPSAAQKVERTLARFAKEAIVQFNQGRLGIPIHVRLFCEKKVIEDVDLGKPPHPLNAEQSSEPTPLIHFPDKDMNGGWGYYVIERGRDSESIPCEESYRVVEVYVYKEGI